VGSGGQAAVFAVAICQIKRECFVANAGWCYRFTIEVASAETDSMR
jgi:hypothetical protein